MKNENKFSLQNYFHLGYNFNYFDSAEPDRSDCKGQLKTNCNSCEIFFVCVWRQNRKYFFVVAA